MSSRRGRAGISEREFETAKAAVLGYFGDLVSEVAVDAPVSRARLCSALAKLQVAGRRREQLLSRSEVAHAGAMERIYQLPTSHWETLERSRDLSASEAVAARTVHRRLAAAMHADRERPGTDPFVLVDPTQVPAADPI